MSKNNSVWDLLQEPLEATIYIKTNSGHQALRLICPTREQIENMTKELVKPEVPSKEVMVKENGRKKSVKELDENDETYVKASQEYDTNFGLKLIDLGLKDRPTDDYEKNKLVYRKLPNPVLEQIVMAIRFLMAHEIPPTGKPDED